MKARSVEFHLKWRDRALRSRCLQADPRRDGLGEAEGLRRLPPLPALPLLLLPLPAPPPRCRQRAPAASRPRARRPPHRPGTAAPPPRCRRALSPPSRPSRQWRRADGGASPSPRPALRCAALPAAPPSPPWGRPIRPAGFPQLTGSGSPGSGWRGARKAPRRPRAGNGSAVMAPGSTSPRPRANPAAAPGAAARPCGAGPGREAVPQPRVCHLRGPRGGRGKKFLIKQLLRRGPGQRSGSPPHEVTSARREAWVVLAVVGHPDGLWEFEFS